MVLALFLTFLVLPTVEIYLFIVVGGLIGGLPAVALTLLSALVGAYLVKRQGLQVMMRAQGSLERGETPVQEVMEGVCLLVAGGLLFVPGFLTDAVGLLLLVPAIRRGVGAALLSRVLTIRTARRRSGETVVEGDFQVVRPDERRGGGDATDRIGHGPEGG
ncbi:MAG: membrane protein FxsA [Alphaproteobacteria bacterium]|nr:membrane protein FxsA [Alphaproteobacteria bacterium]